jgi:putative oxidoreductase
VKSRANFDVGLLVLRLALGAVFIAHGGQKLGIVPGGSGPAGVIEMVGKMGFHPATVWGWLLIAGEFGGGLGVLFGFLTPLAALGIASSMAVAFWKVSRANGFFLNSPGGGYEYVLALFGMAVCLILTGPGRFSLDFLVFGRGRKRAQN